MLFQLTAITVAAMSVSTLAMAQDSAVNNDVPTLIVTNKPIAQVAPQAQSGGQQQAQGRQAMPGQPAAPMVNNRIESVNQNLYARPPQAADITANTVLNPEYFSPVDTMTAQQINDIQQRLYDLQAQVADKAAELQTLEIVGQDLAANYYASIATISTQLQTGTTPGNPRLKNRLNVAEDALDTLSGNVADLNKLAIEVADLATVSNFLQQEARAAYGLSGSVEEDHVQLAQLEDAVSNTAVAIERLLNSVNDDITRSAAYMASERQNLRTLALAISNGDLYGKSLASRPFSTASSTDIATRASFGGSTPSMGMPMTSAATPAEPRPLMKIRFDRPDVDYTQALYMSVNDALRKYPNSTFELVAVSPGMGNPAKLAIEGTRARRNAEKVLRNMVQMGVNTNRVDLANLTKDDIQHNEVHLYVR